MDPPILYTGPPSPSKASLPNPPAPLWTLLLLAAAVGSAPVHHLRAMQSASAPHSSRCDVARLCAASAPPHRVALDLSSCRGAAQLHRRHIWGEGGARAALPPPLPLGERERKVKGEKMGGRKRNPKGEFTYAT